MSADRGARLPLGAEVALASACGLVFFAVMAVLLAVADSRLLPVVLIGSAGIAAVTATLRFWGVAYAVPVAVTGLLAFDWFYIPPTHPHNFPNAENLADLLVYVAVGVLVGELTARIGRRASTSEMARSELADEQAALRRVATLVAEGTPATEVFGAVTEEVGRLLPVDLAVMGRYEPDGTITAIAAWGAPLAQFPLGTRSSLGGENLVTMVRETGRPSRIDRYVDAASGPVADLGRQSAGLRSAVGTPIVVDGRLWGAMVVGSTVEQTLPATTEARLAEFTELVATAIANAESRAALAASRARIVAAADDSRRRIQRDLHDGAQQRLVHSVIVLKLALRALSNGDPNAYELVAEALKHTEQATAELRELAHGILPAALARGGLQAGVKALVSRASVPVSVDVSVGRLPAGIEATAYFVVSEALTNVDKHARADGATVTAQVEPGELRVEVRDDGVGGARGDHGTGLGGLEDRVSALDGRLVLESPPGGGTRVCALLPLPVED